MMSKKKKEGTVNLDIHSRVLLHPASYLFQLANPFWKLFIYMLNMLLKLYR